MDFIKLIFQSLTSNKKYKLGDFLLVAISAYLIFSLHNVNASMGIINDNIDDLNKKVHSLESTVIKHMAVVGTPEYKEHMKNVNRVIDVAIKRNLDHADTIKKNSKNIKKKT